MKEKTPIETMRRRYARLAARMAKPGLLLQGTITERTIVRQDTHDPGRHKTYGPYYQWTFKRRGKTVTVNLTPTQAKRYQRAIDNHRKLEQNLEEMTRLSLDILERTTRGVKKRKSRSTQEIHKS